MRQGGYLESRTLGKVMKRPGRLWSRRVHRLGVAC